MRVLQLIDSLRPGGAERMAVNLANALVPHVSGSFVCCTRMEGDLIQALGPSVKYLLLEKKNSLDIRALKKLKRYIKNNNIDIVHAHGTSYFLAGLLKITGTNIKIVWHEHYGGRSLKKVFNFPILYTFSYLFNGIITVNPDLLLWAEKYLKGKNKIHIPNFVPNQPLLRPQESLIIKDDYIVCLANLKVPKNHLNLLKSFLRVVKEYPGIKLYLIGKDNNDDYKKELEIFINTHNIGNNIIFKGEIMNNFALLKNAKIGVLSSDSEGLPMALLEYGNAGIPIVCTDVGLCGDLVKGYGKVVPVRDDEALAKGILFYLKNPDLGSIDGNLFQNLIEISYSEKKNIPEFLKLYNKLNLHKG
ncbi:glycosyltransferase involved in cell wall biosynthesis [Gillisia sp. Hel_I_86]|uniref:glycosyltransferase n=1 Tax=Gillisia sp. Hel_I_86 TaxID=1249981 RepID=UPI001199727C|nr:glycosyltransferase [Gillisia sp. Hel_I_86]TVZ25559.1 glycosyltransferase involved in cell wall biosynthesis [Gillisia sp. Hel_I_86]